MSLSTSRALRSACSTNGSASALYPGPSFSENRPPKARASSSAENSRDLSRAFDSARPAKKPGADLSHWRASSLELERRLVAMGTAIFSQRLAVVAILSFGTRLGESLKAADQLAARGF